MNELDRYVDQVRTPAYLFSETAFRVRAEQVREAFGPEVDLCFSIKANPFLLNALPDTFAKVEVCSPGELAICKALRIAPERILFSGVNKTPAEIREAITYGAAVLTAESPAHFRMISEAARELQAGDPDRKVAVLLRLTAGSQFGMDKKDLKALIAERGEHPWLEITGIHYFSGTQKRKAKENLRELARLTKLIAELEQEYGFRVRDLEYGAGLDAAYFEKSDAEAEEKELAALREIAPAVRETGESVHLTVEMGRFFAAPCGTYVTTVCDQKICEEVPYAIVDGGAHQVKYDGQLSGMLVPVIGHFSRGGEAQAWTVCGSLCTTADVICRDAELFGLKTGDRLSFHRTGAYSVTEGIALLLSRDLPAVYLVTASGELRLLRDRIETYTLNLPQGL